MKLYVCIHSIVLYKVLLQQFSSGI